MRLSFVVSRIADNALKNTRKAKFEIEVGPQYFDFLAEFLLFLIMSADRIAYLKLSAEDRLVFTGNLANRVAETYAENRSRLLDEDLKECKRRFIDLLNQRAGEYADFGYDENGPDIRLLSLSRLLHRRNHDRCGQRLGHRPDDQLRSAGGNQDGRKDPARLVRSRTEKTAPPHSDQRRLNEQSIRSERY